MQKMQVIVEDCSPTLQHQVFVQDKSLNKLMSFEFSSNLETNMWRCTNIKLKKECQTKWTAWITVTWMNSS